MLNDARDLIAKALADLEDYCDEYNLKDRQSLVQIAKMTFEAEARGLMPSDMTVENHLALVNRRPI